MSVNKVILVGTLGADPETRYSANGNAICSIRIATNESWTDKATGQKQERTEWHRVKFFGRLAEIAGEYLKKGRQVYVEGSLRTDKYTDKDGIERYSTDIIADEMQMLGGAGDRGGAGAGGGGDEYASAPRMTGRRDAPSRAPASAPAPASSAQPAGRNSADDFDDDIPF